MGKRFSLGPHFRRLISREDRSYSVWFGQEKGYDTMGKERRFA